MEQQAQEQRTPLTHTVRKEVLAPIHSRIRALQSALVQVIKARIEEWVASGGDSRIAIEEQIVLRADDTDTLFVVAVDLDRNGIPIAIIEDDMSNSEMKEQLAQLPIDVLAQAVDDLGIEISGGVIPVAEQETGYDHLMKAFGAACATAEALKDQLLDAVAKTHEVLALDLTDPPNDEDLAKLYSPDELDAAISFKDDHDNMDCFAEFTSRAEAQGYRCLFSYDRIDYYIR